jgi:ATP/ADP translocase
MDFTLEQTDIFIICAIIFFVKIIKDNLLVFVKDTKILKHLKIKDLYPLFTFLVSLVAGVIVALLSDKTGVKEIIKLAISKSFLLFAGSLSLYDVVIEKIENFFKRKKDEATI